MREAKIVGWFMAIGVAATLVLGACGSDDDIPDSDVPAIEGQVYRDAGWTTETDPLNNRTFRCLTTARGFNGSYAGGLSTWCYEVTE